MLAQQHASGFDIRRNDEHERQFPVGYSCCWRRSRPLLRRPPTPPIAADRLSASPRHRIRRHRTRRPPPTKAAEARRLADQAAALASACRTARGRKPRGERDRRSNEAGVRRQPGHTLGFARRRRSAHLRFRSTTGSRCARRAPRRAAFRVPCRPSAGAATARRRTARFGSRIHSVPAPLSAATKPIPIAAAGHAPIAEQSDGFELKLTEAALAAESQTQTAERHDRPPSK